MKHSPEPPIQYAERREPGPLSVRSAGRSRVSFAVGQGPWTYTTRSAIQAALLRVEESETGTAQLSGYWLEPSDLEALEGWAR